MRHNDTIEDLNDMRLSSAHWTESECGLIVLKGREDVMLGQLDWENPDVLMMERFIEKMDVLIAAGRWIVKNLKLFFEPMRDKTIEMTLGSSSDSDQAGYPEE